MPFRDPALALNDILEGIGKIEQFVQGYGLNDFAADEKTVAAVERKLQLITEAAVRLGDQAEVLCPEIAWRDIRGIGELAASPV